MFTNDAWRRCANGGLMPAITARSRVWSSQIRMAAVFRRGSAGARPVVGAFVGGLDSGCGGLFFLR